jgi:hypothetical protein
MAISLCSALLAAAALQGRGLDSLDARGQMALGRAYLQRFDESHSRIPHADTAWQRSVLDTAETALTRAAETLDAAGSSVEADSARVLRVRVWSNRARMAWERGGLRLGPDVWGPIPTDLRLPPVLEELGENLLRACPAGGVLLTAGDADSYAAWYMRFVRGLGTDRVVVPFSVWRDDPQFRRRAAADLKLGKRGAEGGDAWLKELVLHRSVCVTMAFARPPVSDVKWSTRPLVWVAGPAPKRNVPPREFVFAAVGMSLADADPWGQAALAVYARAARTVPALCQALATFGVTGTSSGCQR